MGILKKYPTICLGVGITLIFLGLAYMRVDLFDTLERKLYDIRMGLRGSPKSESNIVMVNIDDESVEKLGRWPWPRSQLAKGIDKINAANPRIIGLNIIYSEPSESAALRELGYLAQELAGLATDEGSGKVTEALEAVNKARSRLDSDSKLAESLEKSGKVVLPVYFKNPDVAGDAKKEINLLKGHAIGKITAPERLECPKANEVSMPIPSFLQASADIGHVNLSYDMDGKVRWEELLYRYQDLHIPSFALRLAALSLGVPNENIQVTAGKSISLDFLDIPIASETRLLVSFKGPQGSFKSYPFFDVISDKIPNHVFNNRIVLVTPTAPGILNPISTAADQVMSVGEFTANTMWAMLNRQFIRKPGWDAAAGFAMILFTGALITFVLPRLKAIFSGIAFILLLFFLVAGAFYLFVSRGLWIQITYPLLQLIFGYIGVVSAKYFVTETRKEKIEGESAETTRMLGLSFQSQGMLDMAFDKFRKVPVDDEMKGILYNLGLDYERKRQFNKAAAAYEYIEEHDETYKDVKQRKKKLMQASETMMFGDGLLGGGTSPDNLLSGTSSDTRPTLGRYEIMKPLGKGAMGVVYLGQDPRINRTTAIKTFRFGDDFEPAEAEQMKQKFFREAESAGTLSHPHIVTIYDAGEEQDLAYIAMEYLDGDDLQKYTKKGNLLPMRKVLDHVADIADALNYAHGKGIIHRDIKPANVMLIKSGVTKITDFGIARITASSQTQTGVVKGTPHYMSPEQISGEKVDGRSDIFSLGAMLFQLLTGEVPFKGNSPAALLHQIMNVPHPNPKKLNPKLLKPHVAIIDKAMEKDREKRYQRASQMAAHLRALGKKIDSLRSGLRTG